MPATPAVEAVDLSKRFAIPRPRERSIRHPAGLVRASSRKLEVLAGISFAVQRGEYFGIVGRNGSGKSTLLKLIAGIYKPDAGSVRTEGRVGPVLDLGVGFNPELSTRDNAIINGIILGLSRRDARGRVDHILEFAELGDFADARLKNLSAGMRARLAFATMLEIDPDVLLVDEVLAVGDQRFQERCTEAMTRLHAAGKTIVLVTHAMPVVERLCDRALLLEEGRIDTIGDPADVANRYLEVNAGTEDETGRRDAQDWPARLTSLRMGGRGERARPTIREDEPIRLSGELDVRGPLPGPAARIEIRTARSARVFVSSEMSLVDGSGVGLTAGAGCQIEVEVENRLVPGAYVAVVSILREGQGRRSVLAAEPVSVGFNVEGQASRPTGLVSLAHHARLHRYVGAMR